ncbi:SDR family oxidoreductase [Deinococcus sp.]|uniref:SDR family oxidoreductase n=1 Tax=Deinococcus sp. TaxID=47478 RepID=UPI003CC6202C
MHMNGNTILITGGGSGIGRALAEAFMQRGNTVIIAGRRQNKLDEVTAANPGMKSALLDIEDAGAVQRFAEAIRAEYRALNVLINNAGIMRPEIVTDGTLDTAEATITTNLLGPIRLTAALLPHLLTQPHAAVLTVSSGLAFMPMAATPTYSATKAAIHSYTQSLRHQLRNAGVQVIELVPPYVQTELMGPGQATDPHAMPLAEYIAETLHLLETAPDAQEILVERVKPLRYAEANGSHQAFFERFNAVSAAETEHADPA